MLWAQGHVVNRVKSTEHVLDCGGKRLVRRSLGEGGSAKPLFAAGKSNRFALKKRCRRSRSAAALQKIAVVPHPMESPRAARRSKLFT